MYTKKHPQKKKKKYFVEKEKKKNKKQRLKKEISVRKSIRLSSSSCKLFTQEGGKKVLNRFCFF